MDERTVTELRTEMDALRRRLDEQGSMLKRTNAAVSSLADSLGELVSRQRRRERGLNLNSFVAYTLFTVLLGGGFFALYHARAGDLVDAREAAVAERDTARVRAQQLEDALARRDGAERAAYEYYLMLRDGRSDEVIARYPEVEQQPLSETERAVFASGVELARAKMADAGYLRGLDAFRAGDVDTARTALRGALTYEDEGPRAARMRYYLGLSLLKTAEPADAARELDLALAGRVEQAGVADARFFLAQALEQSGEVDRARAEYDRFANANPTHVRSVVARRKAAQLARQGPRAATN